MKAIVATDTLGETHLLPYNSIAHASLQRGVSVEIFTQTGILIVEDQDRSNELFEKITTSTPMKIKDGVDFDLIHWWPLDLPTVLAAHTFEAKGSGKGFPKLHIQAKLVE